MEISTPDMVAIHEWLLRTTDTEARAMLLRILELRKENGKKNFRWPSPGDTPRVVEQAEPEPIPITPKFVGVDRTWRNYSLQEPPRWARYSSGGTCQFGNHPMEEGTELYVAQCTVKATREKRDLFGCAVCADDLESRWNHEHGVAS